MGELASTDTPNYLIFLFSRRLFLFICSYLSIHPSSQSDQLNFIVSSFRSPHFSLSFHIFILTSFLIASSRFVSVLSLSLPVIESFSWLEDCLFLLVPFFKTKSFLLLLFWSLFLLSIQSIDHPRKSRQTSQWPILLLPSPCTSKHPVKVNE